MPTCLRELVGGDREERGGEGGRRYLHHLASADHIGSPERVQISHHHQPPPNNHSPPVLLFVFLEQGIWQPPESLRPSLQSLSASPQQMISETASAAAAMKKPLSASLACWPLAPPRPPAVLTPAWLWLRCESGLGRWS